MEPVKILIAFYSRGGSTEKLALGIAEGAKSEGADVRLRRVREFVSPEIMARAQGWAEGAAAMNERHEAPAVADMEWADGVLLGSPTRFGSITSELKSFIDSLGGLWFQGALVGKVGGAFTSTSTIHGGNETTIMSMYNMLAHLGMIIVPTGYGDPSLFAAGTPYGASAVSGQTNAPPTDLDLAVAHYQGAHTARIARALKSAGETATKA